MIIFERSKRQQFFWGGESKMKNLVFNFVESGSICARKMNWMKYTHLTSIWIAVKIDRMALRIQLSIFFRGDACIWLTTFNLVTCKAQLNYIRRLKQFINMKNFLLTLTHLILFPIFFPQMKSGFFIMISIHGLNISVHLPVSTMDRIDFYMQKAAIAI